ncbi:MAG: tRNA (N6-threonylcarbamoyladenosine(37)-N6)-methyltransferase TrmO [Candidatus Hadarchaeia archaeon]
MNEKDLSQSDFGYLEAIYVLSEEEKEIRISDIANHLGGKASSTSEKMESLKKKGFVRHDKHGKVSLTEEGREVGEEIVNRQLDLERLFKILGVAQAKAEADASEIKHRLSKETIETLRKFLKFSENEQEQTELREFRNNSKGNYARSKDEQELVPIGTIHTPFEKDKSVPHQTYKSEAKGEIEVFEKYEEGLKDVEGFSHIILLYEFDRPVKKSTKENYHLESYGLKVKPYLDEKPHGLFATRSPDRPNPIGISVVKLLNHKENTLKVKGVDMLDKTPLLDIKPYVPKFDQRKNTRIGWLKNKL